MLGVGEMLFFLAMLPALAGDVPYVQVLGIAQDAGHPQAACDKSCCTNAYEGGGHRVASLGIVDPDSGKRWIIDATPDFTAQMHDLGGLDGVFLTHAHIGHYTGLMYLGREAMGADQMPVYAMPRMSSFLAENGPWNQLSTHGQIQVKGLVDQQPVRLTDNITVTPVLVPHRDEFSETVGFVVAGPNASVFYLPDIDKWERWDTPVESWIAKVDRAYLDGTFFDVSELPGRDMSEIPHPFVKESLQRFGSLASRDKIRFIHFNHSNPLLADGNETAVVTKAGFGVARRSERFSL
jgi:pyrroloquinoline quinone biosynthesis protein B